MDWTPSALSTASTGINPVMHWCKRFWAGVHFYWRMTARDDSIFLQAFLLVIPFEIFFVDLLVLALFVFCNVSVFEIIV